MKSILNYKGKQVEIEVPDIIASGSIWLDDNASADVPEDLYEFIYLKQDEWYASKAIELFNNEDIYVEGFSAKTDEMKKRGILDYVIIGVEGEDESIKYLFPKWFEE